MFYIHQGAKSTLHLVGCETGMLRLGVVWLGRDEGGIAMAALKQLPPAVVFVDVETTGVQSDDRIVSIGAVHLSTDTLRSPVVGIRAVHIVCNPGRSSHPSALAVHGYADRLLSRQDPFAAHAPTILSFIHSASLVVAHNASFDVGFLNRELSACGLPPISIPIFCTMENERSIEPGKSASLKTTASRVGLRRIGDRHDALEDAWLAMMIFLWRHKVPIHDGRFKLEGFPPTNLKRVPDIDPASHVTANGNDSTAAILNRSEPRLRPIPGKAFGGPARDIDEDDDAEESIDLDGLSIGITYEDVGGNLSDRVVRCSLAKRNGDAIYLAGWCQLRDAWRTFRLDRIKAITDYRTGEIDDDVRRFFSAYLPSEWLDLSVKSRRSQTAENWATTGAAKSYADGAKVLLFLAMEDGSLHDREYEFILGYAVKQLARAGYREPVLADLAAQWIRNHVPTARSAKLALNRLIDDPVLGPEIADLIIRLISVDGHVSDAELKSAHALVDTMRKREAATATRSSGSTH